MNEAVKMGPEGIADLKTLLSNAGKDKAEKLTKDVKDALAALINRMAEARAEGLVTYIGLDNGEESGMPALTFFRVIKIIDTFKAPQPGQDNAPQGARR